MADSPMDQLLAPHTDAVREVFAAARSLVRDAIPDATEQVDLPDRMVAYGFGPPGGIRMRSFFAAVAPHKAHVSVQLADGAHLPDPAGIVEGTGKNIRHVKCRTVEDVARAALRALLEEQAARRRPES
jgi:hypothetical protein